MTTVFDAPDNGTTDNPTVIKIGDREFTVPDLEKKVSNADSHIQKIETENADLRKKVEEYMGVLSQLQNTNDKTETTTLEQKPATTGITEEAVAMLVKEQVNNLSTEQQRKANFDLVDKYLKEKFGDVDEAGKALASKAAELNMSIDDVKDLAMRSPNAVLSWFPATKSDENAADPATSFNTRNTEAVQKDMDNFEQGTYKWWQAMRHKEPKRYFSPQMTRQRMNDAARLGREKFFS